MRMAVTKIGALVFEKRNKTKNDQNGCLEK